MIFVLFSTTVTYVDFLEGILKTLSRTESFLGAERKMVSDNFFKMHKL